MKKIVYTLVLLPFIGFGQQLSFEELIAYVTDKKKFELRMFGLGNSIINIEHGEVIYGGDGSTFQCVTSSFGESYDKVKKTAFTFYDLEICEREERNNEEKLRTLVNSALKIFYVNKDTYINILKEIQRVGVYVNTIKFGESFISEYQYGSYIIYTREGINYGGHLNIEYRNW